MNRLPRMFVIAMLALAAPALAATFPNHLVRQMEMLAQVNPPNSLLLDGSPADDALLPSIALPAGLEAPNPSNAELDGEAPVSDGASALPSGLPSDAAVIEIHPSGAEDDPFVEATAIELTFNVPVELTLEDLTLASSREPRLTLAGLQGEGNRWWVYLEEGLRGDELPTIIIGHGQQIVQYRAQGLEGDSHTLTPGQSNLEFAWFDGPGSDPPVVSCCCDSSGVCRLLIGIPCGVGQTPVACPCTENSCPPTGP